MKSTTLNHFHQIGRELKDLRKPPARAQSDNMAGTSAPAISIFGLIDAMASASIEEQRLRVKSVSIKKKNRSARFIKGVAKYIGILKRMTPGIFASASIRTL